MGTTTLVRPGSSPRCGLASGRERGRQLLHARGFRWRRRRQPPLTAKAEDQAACRAELEEWLAEGPEGPTGDDPTTVQVSGAVAPLTGRPPAPVSPELGQGDCAPFLPHLLGASPRQRLLVSHDRGAPQKGAPGETVVREAGGRLILKPQPASSPALNPPERLGTWLRRGVTHHHWLATRGEPIEAIRNFFRYVAGVKDQVRQ